MQLWQDGLVAMLAAVGLASLMWAVVKAVLYAGPERRRQGAAALIPAQGDGELLEQQSGQVRQAAQQAAAGDPSQLMEIMGQLMHSKEGAALVDRIGAQAKQAGLG